jgi:phosphopantetheinyl transferase
MKIFYIKKDEFLEKISRQELEKVSDGKNYKSEKKYIEHLCGLYLVKYIAEKYYNLDNANISLKDKKPEFENSNLKFSLSHSKNIIIAVFSKNNVGIDIEYMANRDFKAILNYYHRQEEPTKEKFYRFWTKYEAEIKLNCEIKSYFSLPLENDYMMTVVSDEPIISDFEIIKISEL